MINSTIKHPSSIHIEGFNNLDIPDNTYKATGIDMPVCTDNILLAYKCDPSQYYENVTADRAKIQA